MAPIYWKCVGNSTGEQIHSHSHLTDMYREWEIEQKSLFNEISELNGKEKVIFHSINLLLAKEWYNDLAKPKSGARIAQTFDALRCDKISQKPHSMKWILQRSLSLARDTVLYKDEEHLVTMHFSEVHQVFLR